MLALRHAAAVKAHAEALGFDLCGVAEAGSSLRREFVRGWLDEGRHASMAWLAGRFEERTDVRAYLPGARSVVVVASSYNPGPEPPVPPGAGRVARYARSPDYHDHMKRRLHALADALRHETGCVTRACVDTAPVLEREWAHRAGIAWQGKNTLAIHPRLGSYVLLGEVVTTADLEPDTPAVDRCGTCRRCLDACPTEALTPYAIDPRRCIAYWTIEHRGEAADIPGDIRHGIGDWLFGCDVCQEVCPWNAKAASATDPHMRPLPVLAAGYLDARRVGEWTDGEARTTLRGTALKRQKPDQLRRNARIVLENAQSDNGQA